VDVLGAYADFDLVDDASRVLGHDQSHFKSAELEVSPCLDVVLESLEELRFIMGGLAGIGVARRVSLPLEADRLIQVDRVSQDASSPTDFVLSERDTPSSNRLVKSGSRNALFHLRKACPRSVVALQASHRIGLLEGVLLQGPLVMVQVVTLKQSFVGVFSDALDALHLRPRSGFLKWRCFLNSLGSGHSNSVNFIIFPDHGHKVNYSLLYFNNTLGGMVVDLMLLLVFLAALAAALAATHTQADEHQ